MMSDKKRQSALERRMREIDEELSSVTRDVETLEQALDKVDLTALMPPAEQEAPPAAAPVTPRGAAPGGPAAGNAAAGLRSAPSPTPVEPAPREKGPPSKDTRFATYYMSREFNSHSRPLRRERSVQRNKAIFMSVAAALVVYWLISTFFL